MARADAGGVKATFGRIVAWLGRAEATRGHFSSTRQPRPDGGRPLNVAIQLIQTRTGRLTACFLVDLSANPWLLSTNPLNKFRRPKYQLQMSFNDLVLIRNRN